jgi:pyridoxine 4-dehydrogenase
VVSVQNRFGPTDRRHDDVLAYCEEHAIAFIPWAPLASGRLAREDSILTAIAARNAATPSQVAIAWALAHSPVIVMIPGTSKLAHLEQNVAAADLRLSEADMRELDQLGRQGSS